MLRMLSSSIHVFNTRWMFIVQAHSRPQTHPDQNPDTADLFQGEDVGEQAWEGVVGVPHRRHEEGRHSTGEDNGNNDDIEDNYVEYGDSNGGDQ